MFNKKLLIILLFLFGNFNNLLAEEYTVFSLGYTKNIAESPHDVDGTTYHNNPEDNGQSFGVAIGSKDDNWMFESEFFYNTQTTHKLTDDVNTDVSAIVVMTNLMGAPDLGEGAYGIFGGGIGFGRTKVDSRYSAGANPGSNSQWTYGYQYIIGFGFNELEFIYKHTDLGTVKSGTPSSYAADRFDYISKSMNIRYKF